MAKGKTVAKPKPKKAGIAPNLKRPREGDSAAVEDLKLQRELLVKKMKARGISARDLATVSGELRKVNATLSIAAGAGKNEQTAAEETRQRAAMVKAQLLKTKAAKDAQAAALSAPEETAVDATEDEEPGADTG